MALFLPALRGRIRSNGNYWSSTENDSSNAYNLNFNSGNVNVNNNNRSREWSVRCLKDLLPCFFYRRAANAARRFLVTASKS